jgi:hypothetical protein
MRKNIYQMKIAPIFISKILNQEMLVKLLNSEQDIANKLEFFLILGIQ